MKSPDDLTLSLMQPATQAEPVIADADWPLFGWSDDVRPALAAAMAGGRPAALATLYRVEGSAPRGAGAQMLFDGSQASGYFSGDCVEGDIARHAAEVLADGTPRRLHYGTGGPWIDIRLRCGGALHILVERVNPGSEAAQALLDRACARQAGLWKSDGVRQTVSAAGQTPLLTAQDDPFRIARRYDPQRRLIVSGGDPGALALAQLAASARFDTILLRPDGPQGPAPIAGVTYRREAPADALPRIGIDRWTAYVGATHEDHHDLEGCLYALRGGAGYTGLIGARSRAAGRAAALLAAGATQEDVSRLHFSPGIAGLGKAPWEVAVGILAEVMQALNPARERV